VKIKVRFEGRGIFVFLASQIASLVPREGYWKQHFEITDNSLSLRTFSGKGEWKVKTEKGNTIVTFKGFRNSFADGTCAFETRALPWEGAEVIRVETSSPERPVSVYLGGGIFLELPFEGKVDMSATRFEVKPS